MTEAKLVQQLQCGEESALEALIRRYSAYVVAVIHSRGRGILTAEDEEELASDVFLALWDGADAIRGETLRPWLAQVAVYKTVDRLRRHKISLPMTDSAAVAPDTVGEALEQQEDVLALRKALCSLSDEDREIFRRFYALDQTADQIASGMSLPAATVRTRLRRGRKKLKLLLEEQASGGR